MRRDDIGIHEMLNGWVKMILTYMDLKQTRRDYIDIHGMLNGWDKMKYTYMRCYTDESRWYWRTWDVKRMRWHDIDIHEM